MNLLSEAIKGVGWLCAGIEAGLALGALGVVVSAVLVFIAERKD